MQRLIELAKQIKNKELREKVISLLNNPKLSNKNFEKYKPEDMSKVKTLFTVGGVGTVERGDLISHTAAVTELCMETAKILEKEYGIKVDMDELIAGALLHDVMKVFEWKNTEKGAERTDISLDHSVLGAAELYSRGFPEKVIHIVASHFGETGPTPPRNFEALILHHVDSFLSLAEFYLYGSEQKQEVPIIILDEKTIKKLSGEE
jgi:7,8-dihydroneopterin 2',3'-cyclic phosphate phosphodiesterase